MSRSLNQRPDYNFIRALGISGLWLQEMCVARLENEGKYAMDLVDATATKVHLIPVCKGLVTHLFGILEKTLLMVDGRFPHYGQASKGDTGV